MYGVVESRTDKCLLALFYVKTCQVSKNIVSYQLFTFFSLPRWFFAMLSVSGTFAVTFSIIFAYVADITDESERSSAYGLVSENSAHQSSNLGRHEEVIVQNVETNLPLILSRSVTTSKGPVTLALIKRTKKRFNNARSRLVE